MGDRMEIEWDRDRVIVGSRMGNRMGIVDVEWNVYGSCSTYRWMFPNKKPSIYWVSPHDELEPPYVMGIPWEEPAFHASTYGFL